MFDIGFSEMIMLAAIALVAIGPKQLPEVARTVGRLLNEFKRATGDITRTFVDARDSASETLSAVTKPQTPKHHSSVDTSDEPSDHAAGDEQMSLPLSEHSESDSDPSGRGES